MFKISATSSTHMKRKSSDWQIPQDLGCMLFSLVCLAVITIVNTCILTLIAKLKPGDLLEIFYAAIGSAAVGTVLLLFARLPLYRQRRFWTFGPGALDPAHRRLYWLAYLLVAASIALFLVVFFKAT